MALAGLLLQVICTQSTFAKSSDKEQVKFAETVKTNILKLGVGQDARVKVKLRDKTKMAGYISEVKSDSFVVTSANTGSTTTVAYANVTQVKGHNLSTGVKILLGVGIGVARMGNRGRNFGSHRPFGVMTVIRLARQGIR